MDRRKFTLDELADETGIEIRTIRSYIQQGLLRGPETRGRNAYYVQHHLHRLLNIKLLKDFYGLRMREVRKVLEDMGDERLDPSKLRLTGKTPQEITISASKEPDTALQYIRRIKSQGKPSTVDQLDKDRGLVRDLKTGASDSGAFEEKFRRWSPPLEHSPFAQLLELLQDKAENLRVPRRTRGESWVHIEVTPDIKLVVRGDYSTDKIALLEQIADYLRQFILGGGSGHGEK